MKEDEKEDQFFVDKRELGELFDSSFDLNVNLFRGRNPNNSDPILYPILKSFLLSNGRVRNEDIKTYRKGGELWVDCKSGGISLFDAKGCPVKSWEYFLLSFDNAKIPKGLVITKDDWHKRFKCFHYTIRPNWDMPVTKFCMLLDNLAECLQKV
ncbi:hypothetical protein [uncultured Microbulbifer sp.]|uniref:Tse2 family ADP-ribosyltransferase toxin n=1 Tax=uncultured Microbulbifer sp. TaxID=348147 RepID=UPI0026037BC2|nr:hypothetical protein [uncultured Microbulbifer sp.]